MVHLQHNQPRQAKAMLSSAIVLLCQFFFFISVSSEYVVPPVKLTPSNYHRWAHYHWIWLHNGLSNQANVTALVDGYNSNNIPIGAVNIDSMWATEFNNFEVNVKKFPDFSGLVAKLHDQNLRVILWATSMVNVENPDFEMCVKNNFLVRDVKGQVFPLHWWHGDGGLLDYTNPEAVAWWHSQMDKVLNVGVDGFKCDGTDPYIDEYIITGGAMGFNNQSISYRSYADMYYRDFFYYSREKRGDAALIMSRPSDCMIDPVSKMCWGYSPKDVVYSGWVGDDDATFNGLRGCARKVLFSAWAGYANFGCDIGGYRGEQQLNKRLFIRWAQLGAFLPLMENGGGGEHRPWIYDQETVAIYRNFAEQHHRLAPYLLTVGAKAMQDGSSSVIPLASRPTDVSPYASPQPSTYNYMLGPDVLVHPVMAEASVNGTAVDVVDAHFPGEQGVEWLDWWKPWDAKLVRKSGDRALLLVPLTSFSVFVRRAALLPLERAPGDSSIEFSWLSPRLGDSASADALEPESAGAGLVAVATFEDTDGTGAGMMTLTISAHVGRASFSVVGISEPAEVQVFAGSSRCSKAYARLSNTWTVSCDGIDQGLKVVASGLRSTI